MKNKKLFEQDTWTDPSSSSATNQTVTVTGGGRVSNYPVSASSMRWLQSQGSAFTAGYVGSLSAGEFANLFLGTNLSSSVAKNLATIKDDAKTAWDAAQDAENDYYDNTYEPEYDDGLERLQAARDAEDAAAFASALADLDALDERLQEFQDDTLAKSAAHTTAITNFGDYIINGRINTPDPYNLDHPIIAELRAKKAIEKKERDVEIQKQIENLKQAASDSQKAAQLNRLKAYGLAALVAGVAVLGVSALFIPSVNAALGPAVIATLKRMFNVAKGSGDDVLKGTSARSSSQTAKMARNFQRQNPGKYNPFLSDKANQLARQQGVGTNVKGQNPAFRKPLKNSYEPSGKVLSEDRKIQILKEIKKPVVVPEPPKKYKMNFSGKYSPQNTPDKTASEITDALVASGNAKGQRWRHKDKAWQGYETTERMNVVYDKVGHGNQAWDMIVNENQKRRGWRDKNIQEQLNIIAHERAMMEQNSNYKSPFIIEQETLNADKDPLIKKVVKRLKRDIDYPEKPSKKGYPDQPPPEMVNGFHPDFGQKDAYYNGLDPESAKTMMNAPTGNPVIDKKVRAAAKKPK